MYQIFQVFAGQMYVGSLMFTPSGDQTFIPRGRPYPCMPDWSDTVIERVAQYKKLHLNRIY